MKNLTFIFLISLHISLFTFHLAAQPCLPEGITFTTQAQIDNFQTNYPNCTEIEGNVGIAGDDITNLNGLNVLTSIGGDMEIGYMVMWWSCKGNPFLISLAGLGNLTTIGGTFRSRPMKTCLVYLVWKT